MPREHDFALIGACINGNVGEVRQLLVQGADPNAKSNDGASALLIASQQGHLELVQVLLDGGADVNAKIKNGMMPLILASSNGYFDVVQALLGKGADVDVMAINGMTALSAAEAEGHSAVTALLLKARATRGNRQEPVEVTPPARDINATDKHGATPLIWAAGAGKTDNIKALIAAGADVNAKADGTGNTALKCAALNGRVACVTVLIAAGADVNAKGTGAWEGHTALMAAAEQGHTEIVAILRAAGAKDGAEVSASLAANADDVCTQQLPTPATPARPTKMTTPLVFQFNAHSPASAEGLAKSAVNLLSAGNVVQGIEWTGWSPSENKATITFSVNCAPERLAVIKAEIKQNLIKMGKLNAHDMIFGNNWISGECVEP